MKQKRKLTNILCATFLAVFVVASALSGILYGISHRADDTVAEVTQEPQLTQTQALNGADKFLSFDFKSDSEVTEENWRDFVDISEISGTSPDCVFASKSSNNFTIKSPVGGYAEGGNYIVTTNKATFSDTSIDSTKPFYFSIEHPEVENVVFADGVIEATAEDIMYYDGEILTTINVSYEVGNIVLFPYFANDMWNTYSAKIEKIVLQEGGQTTAEVSTPTEDEVTVEKEIYGNYQIEIPEDKIIKELDNEMTRAKLMNAPYISDLSEMAAEVFPENAQVIRPGINVSPMVAAEGVQVKDYKKLIPEIEFEWGGKEEGKEDENGNKEDQKFKLKLIFTWDLVKNEGSQGEAGLKLRLTISIKKSISTFISDVNGAKNTATISATTLGIELAFLGEAKAEFSSDLGKTNPTVKNENFKNLSNKDKKAEAMIAQLTKKKKFQEMVNAYKEDQNESKQVVRIVNLLIPICPAVSFSFTLDFIVEMTFSGELGTLHEISWMDESGTIEYKGETENYHSESKVLYGGKVYGSLNLEVKAGLRARAGFAFVGVIKLGVEVGAGAYFEARGLGSFGWGSLKTDEQDDNPFSLYMEAGFYIEIKAFIEIFSFEKEFDIYEFKHALWQNREDNVVEDITDYRTALTEFENPEDYLSAETLKITMGENGVAKLPAIYTRIYHPETEKTYYRELTYDEISVGTSKYLDYSKGNFFEKDSSIRAFEDTINIYRRYNKGTRWIVDYNTLYTIEITKDPVKVESITGFTDVKGVQIGGRIALSSYCTPDNATYKDSVFTLDYVIKDGVKLTTDLGKYAIVEEKGYLRVTNALKIGDKVGIRVRAVKDNVLSEPFEVSVIKVPVTEVRITAADFAKGIGGGERVEIFPKSFPLDATYPIEDVYISTGSEYGQIVLEGGRYYLECFENAPAKQKIGITAVADEGSVKSAEYVFTVGTVALESIAIEDEFGNKFLEHKDGKTNAIEQGATIKLKPVFAPTNATVDSAKFTITEGGTSATINSDGVLTIKERARIGTVVSIVATASNVNSNVYSFVIDKVKVSALELKNYQETTEVKPGGTVQFYPVVTPANATYVSPAYSVTEGGEYAQISNFGTLVVTTNAPVGTRITVKAVVDGVEATYTLNVIPAPAEGIILSSSTDVLTKGSKDGQQLTWTVNPIYATNIDKIEFEIVSGQEYATVSKNGHITVKDTVAVADATVSVWASIEGVYSNTLDFSIYVPVTSVEIKFNGDVDTMQIYMSESFNVVVNPTFASKTEDVEIIVTNNESFVQIAKGVSSYRVTVMEDAIIGDRFSLVAIVDGVRSADYFVTIVKTPVESIDLNGVIEAELALGQSHLLYVTAMPMYATYTNITYKITEGGDYANLVLIGQGDNQRWQLVAKTNESYIGKIVKVVATADGVDSDEIVFTIVENVVEFLEIDDDDFNYVLSPEDSTQLTYVINDEAKGFDVEFFIVSGNEHATITLDGLLTVEKDIYVSNAMIEVVARAGGFTSPSIWYRVDVPITYINIMSSQSDVLVGNEFGVFAIPNSNASNKEVTLEIISGAEYIDVLFVNEYGIGEYKVKSDINVPNAKVVFKASFGGVESLALTVNLIVPVEEVTFEDGYNIAPMQGENVVLSATASPLYATYSTITYRLDNKVLGVSIDSVTGEVTIDEFVAVGSEIKIIARADGVDSTVITLTVQKVPVTEITLTEVNEATEIMVGESISFTVDILPENATYKDIEWTILQGSGGMSISNSGTLTASALRNIIGDTVIVQATVDGMSKTYSVKVNRRKVTDVSMTVDFQNAIAIDGEYYFKAGEVIKVLAFINENALFPEIALNFLSLDFIEKWEEGNRYGDTQEFYITLKDDIEAPNALFTFEVTADGVVSEQRTIHIYNPITEINLISDTLIQDNYVYPDTEYRFVVNTNNGTNNSTNRPVINIIQGSEFFNTDQVTESEYGVLKLRDVGWIDSMFMQNPNRDRKIQIQATGDGVSSNIIELTLMVPVQMIDFTTRPERLQLGDEDKYVAAVVYPSYATRKEVVYSIENQDEVPNVTVDSSTGQIRVENNRQYVGSMVQIKASSFDGTVSMSHHVMLEHISAESLEVYSNNKDDKSRAGKTVQLYTRITPTNATYGGMESDIQYALEENSTMYANITEIGGMLSINPDVPAGTQIGIKARIRDGINSMGEIMWGEYCSPYYITVKEEPVISTSITLPEHIEFGLDARFSFDINVSVDDMPTAYQVTYNISDTTSFVQEGEMIRILRDKENGEKVKNGTRTTIDVSVSFEVDSEPIIVNESFEITVTVPVRLMPQSKPFIIVDNQEVYVITESDTNVKLELQDADHFDNVRYELEQGSMMAGVNIDGEGNISLMPTAVGGSYFTAYASADEVKSESVKFLIYIPVKDLQMNSSSTTVASYTNDALMAEKQDDRISLSVSYNSWYASNSSVRYVITDGEEYVLNKKTVDGNYYIYDNYLQTVTNVGAKGQIIKLKAQVYGDDTPSEINEVVETEEVTIDIIIPVENISISRELGSASTTAFVQQKRSYIYTATIYPAHATHNEITWRVDSSTPIGDFVTVPDTNGTKMTLNVSESATLLEKFKVCAISDNMGEYAYEKSLEQQVEKVWATIFSFSLNSQKEDGPAVTTRVLPGDVLTPVITYDVDNVSAGNKNILCYFKTGFILTQTNNYATISGNKITIKSTSAIKANSPSFTLYINAYGKNSKILATKSITIKIYVPVETITVGTTELERGESNDLKVKYNPVNGGYANPASKDYTVTGTVTKPGKSAVSINSLASEGLDFSKEEVFES